MKNKYTFDKYFKEEILPIIIIFLIGLIICVLAAYSIVYLLVKFEYSGYIMIFSEIAIMIIHSIYDNYQDHKKEYYQEQRNK